jgi:hypothetical protein
MTGRATIRMEAGVYAPVLMTPGFVVRLTGDLTEILCLRCDGSVWRYQARNPGGDERLPGDQSMPSEFQVCRRASAIGFSTVA